MNLQSALGTEIGRLKMPTNPHQGVLYREMSVTQARVMIDIVSPLMQVVNYATKAFIRAQAEATGNLDEDVPIFVLYLHMIEMTDAVQVLLAQSCASAAILQLRSEFQALLSIEYLLQSAADYAQRSLSWVVFNVHDMLNSLEYFDPSTRRGQEYPRAHNLDEAARYTPLPALAAV
jgi:hypothetical protein